MLGRIRDAERLLSDPRAELLLDALEDRAEEIALVAEVVIEGPTGHARPPHDLLDRHLGVAALGEQLARRFDQRLARGLRVFGLEAANTLLLLPDGHQAIIPHTGRVTYKWYVA